MGRVLLPPQILAVEGKVLFLGGPIQGALPWQDDAINIIHSLDNSVIIANPRRKYLDGEFVFEDQVDWETHYLREAGYHGVIMFWLARQHEFIEGRSYAQTTRVELTEWKVRSEYIPINIIIGIESGFSGERYIRRRLEQDCPKIPIHSTLENTCRVAVERNKQ